MAALPDRGGRRGGALLPREGPPLIGRLGGGALAALLAFAALPAPRALADPPDVLAARLTAVEARLREVAKASTPKTVCLRIDEDGKPYGFGSAAVISAEGLLLTCAHVTEPAKGRALVAIFADGRESKVEVVASNSRNDYSLARLVPAGRDLPHFDLAAKDPEVGDWVAALGHPGGPFPDHAPSVSVGKVTGVHRQMPVPLEGKAYVDAIQTDAPIFGGNSGGPLVDLDGNLVGINGLAVLLGDVEFATPASALRAALPTLREGRDVEGRRVGSMIDAMRQLVAEVDFEDLAEVFDDPSLRGMLKGLYAHDPNADDDDDDPDSAPARAPRRGEELRAAFPSPPASAWPPYAARLFRGEVPVAWATLLGTPDGGFVVTSARLVKDDRGVEVQLAPNAKRRPMALVGVDGELDLALYCAPITSPSLSTGGDPVHPGDFVLVAGDGGYAQVGAVSAVRRDVGTERRTPTLGIMKLLRAPNTTPFRPFSKVIQIDCPLEAAQMGAPVLRPDGSLVGVAVAHFHPGCTIVIPAATILERIKAGWKDVPAPPTYGREPRPPREAKPPPPPRTPRVSFHVPTLSGLLRRVRFGDPPPGAEAGTPRGPVCTTGSASPPYAPRAGDVLVSIGGTPAPTVAAAKSALAPLAEGASVPLVLARKDAGWTTETLHAAVRTEDGQRRVVLSK